MTENLPDNVRHQTTDPGSSNNIKRITAKTKWTKSKHIIYRGAKITSDFSAITQTRGGWHRLFYLFYNLFFFFLCWIFIALYRIFVEAHRLLLFWNMGSRVHRLSNWGAQTSSPHSMWDLISPTRDSTCVPCIGRQIFNHWSTRQVPGVEYLKCWEKKTPKPVILQPVKLSSRVKGK